MALLREKLSAFDAPLKNGSFARVQQVAWPRVCWLGEHLILLQRSSERPSPGLFFTDEKISTAKSRNGASTMRLLYINICMYIYREKRGLCTGRRSKGNRRDRQMKVLGIGVGSRRTRRSPLMGYERKQMRPR